MIFPTDSIWLKLRRLLYILDLKVNLYMWYWNIRTERSSDI